jgi:hypothetical protein
MISLEGIPGTVSPEVARIRWVRVPFPEPARAYMADVPDGFLKAICSHDEVMPGQKFWHLSVSHMDNQRRPDRLPTWDELKHAFYRLVQEDIPFVLIFPRRSTPKEKYVNLHETTLHLWQAEEDIDQ